ncbi:MAG TPA: aldo/keto reductase [Acetobacteraceae bacterium]|nr:aldo/keto reductase [Acetobacteraceae bacterium]
MEYRNLGRAGLKVSALSLGSWTTFGESVKDQAAVRSIVAAAYDAGVNFFDMADGYARGESERAMGLALRPFPRHTLVLSSKVFRPMSEDVNDRGLSRKHIMDAVDKSLARIGTDYLDIYFCHRDDPETPIEETVRAMDDLVRAGKVLYWGTSEWPIGKIGEAISIAGRMFHRPQVEQSLYNLLSRERVEGELGDIAKEHGLGLVIWGPLASGLLSGKYDDGIPEGSRLSRLTGPRDQWYSSDFIDRVRRLRRIADEIGAPRSAIALAWLLGRPGVSSVITGAVTLDQLRANLAAHDLRLPEAALREIDAIFPPARVLEAQE